VRDTVAVFLAVSCIKAKRAGTEAEKEADSDGHDSYSYIKQNINRVLFCIPIFFLYGTPIKVIMMGIC